MNFDGDTVISVTGRKGVSYKNVVRALAELYIRTGEKGFEDAVSKAKTYTSRKDPFLKAVRFLSDLRQAELDGNVRPSGFSVMKCYDEIIEKVETLHCDFL